MAKRRPKRDDELSGSEEFDKDLMELYDSVAKGFRDQQERSNGISDNWDLYNQVLGERQFYNGESKIFMPFARDAIEARVTRYANQMFPANNRNVEVSSTEVDLPQALTALLEAYVRRSKLRTQVIPALLRSGDVEGQYNLYVDWNKAERHVVTRVKRQPTTGGLDNAAAEPVDDVEEDVIVDAWPTAEVLSDADVCVMPSTADSIEEALTVGGSVTIIRRWTKSKIKKMIKDGHIRKDSGETLITAMENASKDQNLKDIDSENVKAAGVKGRGKHGLVYETWSLIKVGKGKDGDRLLCRSYFGGQDVILGCKRNPFWNDRCPLLSAPVVKVANVFKGTAPIEAVADLQILANDTINEGADTAHFSAMPIVMTDPERNPRIGSMVLGLAAVWECDPATTQFVQFPELWSSALERASAIRQQIFQTLEVNPSMIPQSSGSKSSKRNQAEIAMEQQVDLLTTADQVTICEEGILTPLVQRYAEYDNQFREDEVVVRAYGDMGLRVTMETVPLIQLGSRWEFRWFGVEANRNAAQIQQQISGLNILQKLPPESHPDHDVDLTPIITQLVENTYGPRLGALIFKPKRLYTFSPEVENDMLEQGFHVPTHTGDDDTAHAQVHMQLMQQSGDPHGTVREHLEAHQQQMLKKAMDQQAQMNGQAAAGGAPGGGPGGPKPQGGTPSGAQPGQPHAPKSPPGAIHPDRMAAAGAVTMPRKT